MYWVFFLQFFIFIFCCCLYLSLQFYDFRVSVLPNRNRIFSFRSIHTWIVFTVSLCQKSRINARRILIIIIMWKLYRRMCRLNGLCVVCQYAATVANELTKIRSWLGYYAANQCVRSVSVCGAYDVQCMRVYFSVGGGEVMPDANQFVHRSSPLLLYRPISDFFFPTIFSTLILVANATTMQTNSCRRCLHTHELRSWNIENHLRHDTCYGRCRKWERDISASAVTTVALLKHTHTTVCEFGAPDNIVRDCLMSNE